MNEFYDTNAYDDEHAGVAAAVRAQRDRMTMGVPVERIISRGRTVRARRRIPTVAAALTVVGAAVLTATALAPPGARSGTDGASTQLAAWTVDDSKSGEVIITLRELHDPAGLQAKLRADGVPAVVTFSKEPAVDKACHSVSALGTGVFPDARGMATAAAASGGIFVLYPARIPHGDAVLLSGFGTVPALPIEETPSVKPTARVTTDPSIFDLLLGLVQATPQCMDS